MSVYKYILPKKWYDYTENASSLRRQKRTAKSLEPIIDNYFDGKIKKYSFVPKKEFAVDSKIIWQYWGQGINKDTVPEIVQLSFDSVDKYKGDYQVIRLTDETLADYIDIPEFVFEKRKSNPKFTMTFFSDLLRLILLRTYGGIWMDATILLTGKIPDSYANLEYFMFQRSLDEPHKTYWFHADPYYFGWQQNFKVRVLNSIIFGKSNSEVLCSLLDILLYIWKERDEIKYYFTFQVIYQEIITRKLPYLKCKIVNDCTPHIIQKKIMLGYPYLNFKEAFEMTPIHKLSYFKPDELALFKKEYELVYNS